MSSGNYNDLWTAPASRNLSVVCTSGKANINRFDLGVTWSSQTSSCWLAQGQTGAAGMVQDFSVTDAYGNPGKMELRNSITDVQNNPGSFYLGSNNTAVYVRTFDSRPADQFIRITKTGFNGRMAVNSTTFYCKNLIFNSGDSAFVLSGNSAGRAIFNQCIFRFGMGNSLSSTSPTQQYLFNCGAYYSRKDGFNYHASGQLRTYEQNCDARFNGVWAVETNNPKNNGSTIHDGGLIIRLNGTYVSNQNRNVHDVSPNTLSYNVGCVAGDSRCPSNTAESAGFAFGLFDENSTNAKAWYIGCSNTAGSRHGLQVHPKARVTLNNCNFTSALIQEVLPGAADTTGPFLITPGGVSISADQPSVIVLTYNETLLSSSVPSTSAYTVTGGKTVSSVSIVADQVFVTVSPAFSGGNTATISYAAPATGGAVQDVSGNKAGSLSPQSFTLIAPDTTVPTYISISGSGNTVNIGYDEALSTTVIPPTSAFNVSNSTVSSVSISGSTVTLTLAAAMTSSTVQNVTYNPPLTSRI